jgi:TetR/AcrR family transcriptional regulator, tetracycline repressor protein
LREDGGVVPRRRGGIQDPPLTVDDVVQAGVRVTELVGLDRLTVRLVADELEVTPQAVYYHLRDKEDLLDRVCEEIAARIPAEVGTSGAWEDRYVALVLGMEGTLSRYPGVGLRALAATGNSAAARRLASVAVQLLRAGGLGEADVVEAFAASQFLLTGWLVLRGPGEGGAAHPALAAVGVTAPADGETALLEVALRRLLAGFPPGSENGVAVC